MQENAMMVREQNPYAVMDALDDELIKAELENRIVDTWVYQFKSDGKDQAGLSKVGVDAACTEMAKKGNVIREGEITWQQDPTDKEYMLFSSIATRYVVTPDGKEIKMEQVNGAKRQWTKQKRRDGSVMEDPFWFEKGSMKSLRNARSRLIPEDIRTKIIAFAKENKKTRVIDEPIPEEKPTNVSAFHKAFDSAKEALGEDAYHDILKKHGFSNRAEIKKREDQKKVWKALSEEIDKMNAMGNNA